MSASPQPVETASIGPPMSPSVVDSAPSGAMDKIWAKFEARLRTIYTMIIDIQPLPAQFPFDFALKSYIWRAIYMTFFTLGARLGGLSLVETIATENGGQLWIEIQKDSDRPYAGVKIGKEEQYEEIERKYFHRPKFPEEDIWWKMETAVEPDEVEESDWTVETDENEQTEEVERPEKVEESEEVEE